MKNINRNSTLSEKFQKPVENLKKEAKSITLGQKYVSYLSDLLICILLNNKPVTLLHSSEECKLLIFVILFFEG
jgi:hypothetical protein